MSHLQSKLADIDQTNLIFGSDEEFAAVKAVNLSFPNAPKAQALVARTTPLFLTYKFIFNNNIISIYIGSTHAI
jgi:hypothetical protein